jgi:hypothetical protein
LTRGQQPPSLLFLSRIHQINGSPWNVAVTAQMWWHAVSALVGSASENEPTTLHVSTGLALQASSVGSSNATLCGARFTTPHKVVTYLV